MCVFLVCACLHLIVAWRLFQCPDDTHLLVRNAVAAFLRAPTQLAQNDSVAPRIERLLARASAASLVATMAALQDKVAVLANHYCASHVLQTALVAR